MRARILVCALALSACGPATESFVASPRDYDLYRRTRTATTTDKRLRASHDYLQKMPEGRWKKQVEGWFGKAEPIFFQRSEKSIAGLRGYLAALPDGPHAKQATEKLAGVEATRRLERARDDRMMDEAREVEDKLADADRMRKELVREVSDWSARLASIKSFGQPTSALASDTIYHFRLEQPVGHCADERCVKELKLPYAIPQEKKLVPRTALLDIELFLYRGGVASARLAGPELWNRVAEASELRPVAPNDKQARAEAIARAVQIVSGALGPAFGDPSCEREAVSPNVLVRECQGVRITMRAAATSDVDDDLSVEPVPSGK